ncbi:MAG TPA: hypothetical protein VK498_04345 [Ferruginibacter sp.]|nr:hypothetical protein [Ferruginibacter sp.]
MERVETLSNKLQELIRQRAPLEQILLTVQMLHSELVHLQSTQPATQENPVTVNIASSVSADSLKVSKSDTFKAEEKTVEILQVDEAALEAELDEIRKNAVAKNKISSLNRPPIFFDPVEDTPTLTHQKPVDQPVRKKELHESISKDNPASLNDKLKQIKIELSDSLQEAPVRDLKKAIGVNDRFLFIKELFRGDEVMYERSIKTINGFSIYPEAEYWIKRELKLKLGWNDNNDVVKQFDQLVRRRFSSM